MGSSVGRGKAPAVSIVKTCHCNELYKWQAQLRTNGQARAFRGPGAISVSESSEIERLKRELKQVIEERDISNKAAYFAKELP